jgi:dodecin
MKRGAALAVVSALVLPAIVSTTIVVNHGMFGVNLGDTMKQVGQKLGPPSDVGHGGGLTFWIYPGRKLDLGFRGKRGPATGKEVRHRLQHGLGRSCGQRFDRLASVGSTADNLHVPTQGAAMSDHVYSVSEIVGSSPDSIEDAINSALGRASKTLRHMNWFEVTELRGYLTSEGTVDYYQVGLKLGFRMEE